MSVASPKFPSALPSTNRFRRFKVLWMNFNNHIDRCAYKNNAAVNELDFVWKSRKKTIASELYTKKSLTRASKLQRNWNYIIQNENYSIFVYHLCVRLDVYCFRVNYSISTRDEIENVSKKRKNEMGPSIWEIGKCLLALDLNIYIQCFFLYCSQWAFLSKTQNKNRHTLTSKYIEKLVFASKDQWKARCCVILQKRIRGGNNGIANEIRYDNMCICQLFSAFQQPASQSANQRNELRKISKLRTSRIDYKSFKWFLQSDESKNTQTFDDVVGEKDEWKKPARNICNAKKRPKDREPHKYPTYS